MHRRIIPFFITILFLPHITQAASLSSQLNTLFRQQQLVSANQSACISGPTGSILSQNANTLIIPASVSKIYTTDWAITTLPATFRYTTDFYLQGTTLYINGTADPHFVIEHLRAVLAEIHADKHVIIKKIVFSPTFYYNWKHTPQDVLVTLRQSIADELKVNPNFPVSSKVSIVAATNGFTGIGTHYQFQSMPLPNLLKQINDYSTNISADTLFNRLGGSAGFAAYMLRTYGAGAGTIHFETGSGLYGNYTTCNLTVRVLQHLEQQLQKQGLELTDVLTVPTLDPGVLQKRTIDPDDAKAMVAKSGTVNYHQSLAGAIHTTKGSQYFAIFTDFNSISKTQSIKGMIDTFIGALLKSERSLLKPFNYTPDPNAFTNFKVLK